MAAESQTCALGNHANHLSSPICQPIITLIMQNEPNFPDDQMNESPVITKDYENIANWTLGENEPNQSQLKPIKPKTNPIKPNLKTLTQRVGRTRAGQAGHTRSCFGHFSKVVILFAE